MNGTKPKCPNRVSKVVGWRRTDDIVGHEPITRIIPCGDERYEIIDPHPFSEDSGLDPKAVLVRCKVCGCEYYVFPALSCPAGAK